MPFKRSVLRIAHTPGHTHCCYSETGDRIITSGADGDIRIWVDLDDGDPTSQCIGEYVLCVVQYNERIIATTDLNTVQAYTYPDGNRDGTEFRFTAPATCIRVNKNFIAAGSEDTVIKVSPLGKIDQTFELTGHEGPILRIDLSPNDLLASSSGDGTVRLWNLNKRSEIHCIKNVDKVKTFFAATKFASPSFEPIKGKYLAYPNGKTITVISTENFHVVQTLTNDKVKSDYTVCSYSLCGKYMAAGTVNGEISLWNVNTCEALDGHIEDKECQRITEIAWHPRNKDQFAFINNTGQLGIVFNLSTEINSADTASLDNQSEIDVDFGDIEFNGNGDDDDEDDENCISLEKLKKETLKPTAIADDDVIDDGQSDILQKQDNVIIESYKPPPLQPPFQPGSTPHNLEHRYMVWNNIGIVRAHTADNVDTIEAEFHDASVHHALHMANYHNHTMASLSANVLALSGETPSQLVCIVLSAGSREWSIAMPNCEEVLALTASTKLVVVATDARYLRIFSAMGTQREVIALPGPIVALSAHNDTILATYHSSVPATNDQHISWMLIQVIGLSLKVRDGKLPLAPMSKLKWLGFSDCGSPVFYDSAGIVKMMNLKGNYWMPICDTHLHIKNESDNFFLIDVSELNQIVRAIKCRGSLYPLTTPRPMVSELPMESPMCALESEKTQLEELLIRNANFTIENAEAQMKEVAIKLFAHACRSEMEARAKELIEMIASPVLLSLAIKYASKLGRIHLAERLGQLMPEFEAQEIDRKQTINDIELQAINLLQNTPMNATLLLQQKKDKSTTPTIAPKPIIASQKRNPFKRNSTPMYTKSITNPLSHLTDKVIGYSDTQDTLGGITPIALDEQSTNELLLSNNGSESAIGDEIFGDTQNILVNNQQSSASSSSSMTPGKSIPPFMTWFNENKIDLQSEFPGCTPAELTKKAMRKYKTLSPTTIGKNVTKESNKRKITDDDTIKMSGIAKLAKFGFNKIGDEKMGK